MLHCGMGHTKVSNFLASINVPPPSPATLKRRENEVGVALEDVAKETCEDALREEKTLSPTNSEVSELTVSYDMGWQRRGTGRAYNSLSGHGTLIGIKSRKVISYGTKVSTCRICDRAKEIGETPRDHDCRKNWSGTAKAMEPSLGVELLQQSTTADGKITTLVMDDDSTTVAKVHQLYDPNCQKLSDTNHASKAFVSALYKLQPTHKVLTTKVINYLKKCYMYVLHQNKENASGVEEGLENVVPHVFGEHSKCGDWCRFKSNPSAKYSTLPHGKPLTGDDLRRDLKKVFNSHAKNAEKLAPLASTLANESMNNIIASKAPKSHHYASSASLDYRVAAAVAQKNSGQTYLQKVYDNKSLSPARILVQKALKSNEKHEKRKSKAHTSLFKKRRLELKERRSKKGQSAEIREGESYQTGVAYQDTYDTENIPPPQLPPIKEPLPEEQYSYVFFDLETTDLSTLSSITQIACFCDGNELNVYTFPSKSISPDATRVTGLAIHHGHLELHGTVVVAYTLKDGLEKFLQFLENITMPVLVGHNITNFDTIILLRHLHTYDLLERFHQCTAGLIDTLPLMKQKYTNQTSYSQENLVKSLLNKSYPAHNALEDVKALQDLWHSSDPGSWVLKFSYTTTWAWEHMVFLDKKKVAKGTFTKAIAEKAISSYTAEKCAASGLQWHHLKLAYQRDPADGIRKLFVEEAEGVPRVSSRPTVSVISKLSAYIGGTVEKE